MVKYEKRLSGMFIGSLVQEFLVLVAACALGDGDEGEPLDHLIVERIVFRLEMDFDLRVCLVRTLRVKGVMSCVDEEFPRLVVAVEDGIERIADMLVAFGVEPVANVAHVGDQVDLVALEEPVGCIDKAYRRDVWVHVGVGHQADLEEWLLGHERRRQRQGSDE